jgi:hypothetical protein
MKKFNKGSVLVAVIILLSGLMTVGVALTSTVASSSIKIQRQYKKLSALSYAEAGVNKGLWKINTGDLTYATGGNGVLENDISGGEYRVKITDCLGVEDCKYIESTGFLPTEVRPDAQKTVRVKINGVQNVTSLNFNYSAQSNANQISMSNNSTIKGSAYSNGPIYMGNGAKITGNATSTGSSPAISYITGGRVNGNAAAYTITSTTVDGTKTTGVYPPTQGPPIAPADLESTIDAFEATATAGGVTTGNVNLSGTNNTLGPRQINGNLTLSNNAELKITGNIWVNGNISVSNNAKIYLDSSFGNNSAIIIADYKSNRADWTKGLISLSNNVTISGIDKNNPKTPSYILMFSTQSPKSPAEPSNWMSYPAIDVSNNVHGGVYYAPFGSYAQSNVAQIRAVVANGLVLKNNATIDYDGNWGNSGISTGPAGKWTITEWLILE